MTEKQFKLFVGNNYGIQSADGEVIIDSIISVGDAEVLCDLLNDLLGENEQIKYALNQRTTQCDKYYEENEQLKFELKECREHKLFSRRELEKENEQLKKQIERIDFILDDLNGAEYISRDDGIKALNKIDKVIGKR